MRNNYYDHYFALYGDMHCPAIDWRWLKAMAIVESGLNPEAVSPVGAMGLMQLMPGTARETAAKIGVPYRDDTVLFVPHCNIQLGAAYTMRCWQVWREEDGLERIRFAIGSYNAGIGNIVRAQKLAMDNGEATNAWASITRYLPAVTGTNAAETINHVIRVEQVYTREVQA